MRMTTISSRAGNKKPSYELTTLTPIEEPAAPTTENRAD
jgi:hypothetical protein